MTLPRRVNQGNNEKIKNGGKERRGGARGKTEKPPGPRAYFCLPPFSLQIGGI